MRPLYLLLLLLLTACESATKPSQSADSDAKPAVVVTAHALPSSTPQRVVSLAPNVTELLFALNLGERVVGVTRYCDWPPEAKGRPVIGGFIDPDIEAILAQRPELVIGMTSPGNEALPQALKRAGLPHLFLRMDTLDQTVEATRALGRLLHIAPRADALAAQIAQGLVPAPAGADRPSALFVLGHDPIVVAGPGSFGHELLILAGATNAAAHLHSPYPTLDAEAVVALAPTLIIDTTMTPEQGAPPVSRWAKWGAIPAVKAGRVYSFSDPSLLRPGPRLPEALRRVRAAVEAPPAPQP
jgi:iron complex transport system substrate-binding protein